MIYKFSHPEWFEGIAKPKLTPQDTIILWGAGKVGGIVAHSAVKQGLKIEAFVDSAEDKQGKTAFGYRIISPQELYDTYPDAVVIVSCAFPIVYKELTKSTIQRVYDPHSFLLEVDFSEYAGGLTIEYACRTIDQAMRNYALFYDSGPQIQHISVLITDKCSLNCKNCDGYIPYHVNPRTDDFNFVVESYKRVIKACEYVEAIDLLGGEPLVHPNIAEITKYFVEDNHCQKVAIITNGTILPSDNLVQAMKSPKFTLRISDYGNLSKRKQEIIELCREEGIKLEITNYKHWDHVPLIQQTNESTSQLDSKYSACTSSVLYMKHGKIFQCTFVAGLSDLGERLIPDFEMNYVDLFQTEGDELTEKIMKFVQQLHDRRHLDACKYCPGSHCIHFENKVPVAEQAKGKLPLDLLFKDGVRLCD